MLFGSWRWKSAPGRLPSNLCWEDRAFHSDSHGIKCTCVCECVCVYGNCSDPLTHPSLLPRFKTKHSADKGSAVDLKEWGRQKNSSCFPFPSRVSPSIMFCYAMRELMWTVWGYRDWREQREGSHLWMVAADGSGCARAELLTPSAELSL